MEKLRKELEHTKSLKGVKRKVNSQDEDVHTYIKNINIPEEMALIFFWDGESIWIFAIRIKGKYWRVELGNELFLHLCSRKKRREDITGMQWSEGKKMFI